MESSLRIYVRAMNFKYGIVLCLCLNFETKLKLYHVSCFVVNGFYHV